MIPKKENIFIKTLIIKHEIKGKEKRKKKFNSQTDCYIKSLQKKCLYKRKILQNYTPFYDYF